MNSRYVTAKQNIFLIYIFLDKHDIKYHICENCGFLQTEDLTGWMNLMLNLMFQIQATCNEIFIYLKN